jgi:hypothetical protein
MNTELIGRPNQVLAQASRDFRCAMRCDVVYAAEPSHGSLVGCSEEVASYC